MSNLNRRLIIGAALAACTAAVILPGTAQAYGYRGGGWGYRGGWGGYGVGLGAGLLAGSYYGGYYGGYYGPRPYYAAPPVVYAPPPAYYYPPAPRVAYEIPPAPRPIVHRPRVVHHVAVAKPAVCVPPALTGPLPKAPLTP
jgi:hypothetical protein